MVTRITFLTCQLQSFPLAKKKFTDRRMQPLLLPPVRWHCRHLLKRASKRKSLSLVVFSCHLSTCISTNVLIPVLENTFMLCYFSYLLALTCSGYLTHNNFGNKNWVVFRLPRLFRLTLSYIFKYPSSMTALALPNFSATKTVCRRRWHSVPPWFLGAAWRK